LKNIHKIKIIKRFGKYFLGLLFYLPGGTAYLKVFFERGKAAFFIQ